MIRIDQTNRTIYDDYIVKCHSIVGGWKVVKKFEELGYKFAASVQKIDCYYIAQRVVMDDGYFASNGESELKLVSWGRSEVEKSNEFDRMMTYEEFMGEKEPEDKN